MTIKKLSPEERDLIDKAVAAGKVTVVPTNMTAAMAGERAPSMTISRRLEAQKLDKRDQAIYRAVMRGIPLLQLSHEYGITTHRIKVIVKNMKSRVR